MKRNLKQITSRSSPPGGVDGLAQDQANPEDINHCEHVDMPHVP